ncbi:papain family cysteine protease [Ancylostoma duodenale]|uniref:Papain family cysteine protease n=1 Tax=Ancylostoma duodenale TaxID=51022 RepID=A0A0C2GRA4_9BILA|nr:papain family cysteine protease [Ancylostoma duodenale]
MCEPSRIEHPKMWFLIALMVTAFAEEPKTIEQLLAEPIPEYAQQLTGQALVDYVNQNQQFYKAVYSPKAEELAKFRVMDLKFLVKPKKEEVKMDIFGDDEEPPENFDSRERWPQCPSIGYIRDQSKCGSCWAVAAAGAMSDQLCAQSNGKIKNVCMPYPFHPCGKHEGQPYYGECPSQTGWPSPVCRKKCNRKYRKDYKDDKYFGE